jgi:hypothetical protein
MKTQAQQAQATAQAQIKAQQASSALAIHQQKLATQLQLGQKAVKVERRTRKKVGTPSALRTGLEITSGLGGGTGGTAGTSSGLGGI